jgi:nucleosome binding factor SPN SPT16 subunit
VETLFNILAIVVPGLYLLSARQRKILFNLIMSWALNIMNWMLLFFLGLWTTLQVLDTDFVNNLLSDDETEQISEDPEQREDAPESTDEDLPEPSENKDEEIDEENEEEEDEESPKDNQNLPTKAYT